MSELEGLFDNPLGAESTVEDATATSDIEASTEEVNDMVEVEQTEHVEEHAQTEETETEQSDAGQEQSEEVDWKAKYEEAEDLRRKNQSYSDSRYNELDKKLNEIVQSVGQGSQQQQQEVEKMSKEDLADLMYSDPEKAIQHVMSQMAPQQQASQANIDLQVQEGVQRSLHSDYDEVVGNLKAVASYHPEIIEKIQASQNKAQVAYEEGLKLQQIAKMKEDPEAFEKQLREKILREMEEGNETKTRPNLRKVPSSPRSSGKKVNNDPFAGLFDNGVKRAASR